MTTFAIDDHRNLTLSIKVDGRTRWVSFSFPVIYGNRGNSTFSTSDPKLIEALKNHKEFGSLFYIKNDDAENAEINENGAIIHADNKAIEDDLTEPENAIIVESVTTKGMAVAYIQGMYGESFTATSVEEMKREAAKKWNTLFPKWGK
jgi:hypothetical protein